MSFYFLDATAFACLFVREAGTEALAALLEEVEDNHKLISAVTPLEVRAAIGRRQRAGDIAPEAGAAALDRLHAESARIVQQPLNPAVLEAAQLLLDRTLLRWPEALQLASALVAHEMYPGTRIAFVSASAALLEAAKAEGLDAIDPAKLSVSASGKQDESAGAAEPSA